MFDKFLKRVENIEIIEEIARFEQFLILTRCFQKSSAAEVYMGKVKVLFLRILNYRVHFESSEHKD